MATTDADIAQKLAQARADFRRARGGEQRRLLARRILLYRQWGAQRAEHARIRRAAAAPWTCPACTVENPAGSTTCAVCGGARSGAAARRAAARLMQPARPERPKGWFHKRTGYSFPGLFGRKSRRGGRRRRRHRRRVRRRTRRRRHPKRKKRRRRRGTRRPRRRKRGRQTRRHGI